jgi:adenine deaminase
MGRDKTDRATLIETARGERKADLVIKNGTLIDVFSNKLRTCHVAVKGGYIVGFGDYRGEKYIDAEGGYVSPGFIDGHTHIESTFLSPQEFGRLCLTSGVTAVVADPHEIANVLGLPGVLWMLEMARYSPMRIFYSCPSSVPSSPLESPGGKIDLDDMRKLKGRKEIVALGEVMDFQGLAQGKRDLIEKVELFEGYALEGHAPGLRGKNLSAYRVSGVSSDHESEDPMEAEEKLANGFHVMVREGSVARNFEALLPFLMKFQENGRISIVSDDMNILDMARTNYLGTVLARGAAMGIDPLNLVRMVTLNTAMRFNFTRLGAIAPGYLADMVIYENLKDFNPRLVLVGGETVFRSGEPPPEVKAPVKIKKGGGVTLPPLFSPDTFRVKKRRRALKVIHVTPGQLTNRIQLDRDLVKICVIERHRGTGKVGKGFVKGLKLNKGSVGLTFAHDAHNLVVAGSGDKEMFDAAMQVARMITVSDGSGAEASLPLKVGGIVSARRWEEVAGGMEKVKQVCERISPLGLDILNILSFIALPVIPEGRVTDRGFIDVDAYRKVSLWD